jgi:radical SAM superfamily enzyme YgiQ (UPF0313 family)
MRVLLIQPAPFEDRRLGLENSIWLSEPLALMSVAAMLPDCEVVILDMRLEEPQALPRTLAQFKPDIVGTTAMTTDAYQAQAVLRVARTLCPNALTMIGGHHCTMLPSFYHQEYVDVIVKGEGEHTLRELVDAWSEMLQNGGSHDSTVLKDVLGIELRLPDGTYVTNEKRPDSDLDALPRPNRELITDYKGKYFFLAAQPMASIYTSRGCSFDCNFCAIWEFYDRRTRFLSAKNIVDRMEACEEPFVFFLDDNFLSRTDRLVALADELERRGVKKWWMSQGRVDFIAKNPDLIARLAKVGMMGILSGYESNDADALAALKKRSSLEYNRKAAEILRENGIVSTGIFMVRPDFEEKDFEALYEYILELGVAVPLVTIWTPLPGTQLYREQHDRLLTKDYRLYDLLHSVVPTKLPREEFYKNYVKWEAISDQCRKNWFQRDTLRKRWRFYLRVLPRLPQTIFRLRRYRKIQYDYRSYLRDEKGIITQNHPFPATPDQSKAAK